MASPTETRIAAPGGSWPGDLVTLSNTEAGA
jgi:hypothetical protein